MYSHTCNELRPHRQTRTIMYVQTQQTGLMSTFLRKACQLFLDTVTVIGKWTMDIHHRRSIFGMVFFLARAVVSWKTRVQPTVAHSIVESEFLSASGSGCLGLFV
jgi:hypothetical protein